MKGLLFTILALFISITANAETQDSVSVECKYHLGTYYYKFDVGGNIKYYSLYRENYQDVETIMTVGTNISVDDYNRVSSESQVIRIAQSHDYSTNNRIGQKDWNKNIVNNEDRYFSIGFGFAWMHICDGTFGKQIYNDEKLMRNAYGFNINATGDIAFDDSYLYACTGADFHVVRGTADGNAFGSKLKTEATSFGISVPFGLKYYIGVGEDSYLIPSIGAGALFASSYAKMTDPSTLLSVSNRDDKLTYLCYVGLELKLGHTRIKALWYPKYVEKTKLFTFNVGYDF